MSNRKCPKCAAKMNKILEQFSIAWVCPKCGYGEASTISTAPIYEDHNTYSIILGENDANDINVIRALSKFTGLNYLQTKELIKTPKLIYSGKAYELLEKKKKLDDGKVNYRIEPKFPYK